MNGNAIVICNNSRTSLRQLGRISSIGRQRCVAERDPSRRGVREVAARQLASAAST